MAMQTMKLAGALTLATLLAACGEQATVSSEKGYGPDPTLPPPNKTMLPTVNIAKAVGWPDGGKPIAGAGLSVTAFASGLTHPRTLLVLPNGDVLVAETNAPPKPDDSPGIRGWVMEKVMARAGAGVPSPNRITLLRDTDNDGVADMSSVYIDKLNSPFGMALVGNDLYVANSDAIVRFSYREGERAITTAGTKLVDLPAGPINHHWTKDLVASPDGSKLYVTIGSNSNVAENGIEVEHDRAQIWEIDRATGAKRVFATGIRNPNGPAFQPDSGELWVVVNERDEIGSDLVPDYMTSVKDGGFYGWPYSYYGQTVDDRVKPQKPDLVAKAIKPDYALGAHTASLGLAFDTGDLFPDSYKGGAFIGQHGSWNRNPHNGYKVVFVPFKTGMPAGEPRDILTGFLNDKGEAQGRPVGVKIDSKGALLVADDVGNKVWRVTPDNKAAEAK